MLSCQLLLFTYSVGCLYPIVSRSSYVNEHVMYDGPAVPLPLHGRSRTSGQMSIGQASQIGEREE